MIAARIWRVTWTLLGCVSNIAIKRLSSVPKSSLPDICSRFLLQKCADLLQLLSARRGIVEQIAELGRQGMDLLYGLLIFGIAFQDQDLMFGATFLLRGVDGIEQGAHGDGGARSGWGLTELCSAIDGNVTEYSAAC